MNTATHAPVYWDPYRPEFWMNPYPVFKRLREEAPLYRNDEYDFYAVSRFSDVERGFTEREIFSSLLIVSTTPAIFSITSPFQNRITR